MDTTINERLLASLDRGFRRTYLDYEQLTGQVNDWAETFPDLITAHSIGTTPEERSIWLLIVGPEPERIRPAVWINGNVHASEFCGSSVALAIAEDMLRLHLGIDAGRQELPVAIIERLKDVLFYVVPRVSPDGAEHVLKTGRFVRSVPRDDRHDRSAPYWCSDDVDGDGVALRMRVQDPGGEFIESEEIPGLMVPRRIEDPGPYYKIYPEGFIENFDGHTIPSPSFLCDNPTDLNRNFPWSWAPEHVQMGAGAFPTCEPESRAVVEFTTAHPNIFAWLDLHTFGGVFIRPLGHAPDNKMDPDDLALFRQVGAWGEEFTGYPMVSGFEDFTYEPDKPLHGDLIDYAYHQRGCVAYTIELWDLFRHLGEVRSFKRFVDRYTHITREDIVKLGKWDREHNRARILQPWKRRKHEQLGEVEVGGVDPRFGLWNPPFEKIAEVCIQQSAAFLRVAALAPVLEFGKIAVSAVGDDLFRVTVTVRNQGYLPTYILSSARDLDIAEPLHMAAATEGCELVDSGAAHRQIGHLDGWGRGLFDGTGAFYHLASRGNTGAKTVSYLVRGRGTLTLRLGCCRTGTIETLVEIESGFRNASGR